MNKTQPSLNIPTTRLIKKPPPIKESALVNLILATLLFRYKTTLKLWRNNTGAFKTEGGKFLRFGSAGSPDLIGVLCPGGRFVGLEVKTDKGKLSPQQAAWLQDAGDLGALVGVVRSVEEAIALIESGRVVA